MDREYMRRRLPENPPKDMIRWVLRQVPEELGGAYTVFRGERVRLAPDLEDIMEYNQTKGKSMWATYCFCSNCTEDYHTKKVAGRDAFYIAEGEDGMSYPVEPDWNGADDATCCEVAEGDRFLCPICGCETRAISAKSIRGGRTKRIQVASLHAIDGYAVIVYWLVARETCEYGDICNAVPRYAYVLGERGGLSAFTHVQANGFFQETFRLEWQQLSDNQDRWDTIYHDWGSINNKKAGTVMYPNELPSMVGTTGEKTGLLAYWKSGGKHPVEYLKLWKRWKALENLCNAGFAGIVAEVVEVSSWVAEQKIRDALDLSRRKPHEILRMTKGDFRLICGRKRKPDLSDIQLWAQYLRAGGTLGAAAFFEQMDTFGRTGIRAALQIMKVYQDCDLNKLHHYMEKQGLRPNEVGLLLDTRNAYWRLSGRRALTEEERFPRRLQEVHDRLAEQIRAVESAETAAQYQKGFDKVLERFGGIQWTDKELSILLPRCNGDLIQEGEVLRHCVGGYGRTHSEGESIILFVRHYRRPERPYYTLNISFSGGEPKEIQLHGYGNEHHGDHKQYRHSIPQKVRQFVDRWKKEVLLPWWREQMKKERKTA